MSTLAASTWKKRGLQGVMSKRSGKQLRPEMKDGAGWRRNMELDFNHPFGVVPSKSETILQGELSMRMLQARWGRHLAFLTSQGLSICRTTTPDIVSNLVLAEDIISVGAVDPATQPLSHSATQSSVLLIETELPGHEETRDYFLKFENSQEAAEWQKAIQNVVLDLRNRQDSAAGSETWQWIHSSVAGVYRKPLTQSLFAAAIFGNFIADAIEAELHPDLHTPTWQTFHSLEILFTTVFVLELMLSLISAGNETLAWMSDQWHVFDTIVVIASIVSLMLDGLPALGILRVIRGFRILRLFGRLKTLRRITNSLLSSWAPVLNAMTVVAFTTGIYSIIGAQFLSDRSPQHFGTFSRALFTMFTVITFDGWTEMMLTDLMVDGAMEPPLILFFVSFVVIVVWTMLSVVVAIMLDSFATASEKQEVLVREFHNLDPLLNVFSTFISSNHLSYTIHQLCEFLNVEQAEALTRIEVCDGLRKFRRYGVHLTSEDWRRITQEERLCNKDGKLGPKELEKVMYLQLVDFVQEKCSQEMLRNASRGGDLDGGGLVLASLKLLHHDVLLEDPEDPTAISSVSGSFKARASMVDPGDLASAVEKLNRRLDTFEPLKTKVASIEHLLLQHLVPGQKQQNGDSSTAQHLSTASVPQIDGARRRAGSEGNNILRSASPEDGTDPATPTELIRLDSLLHSLTQPKATEPPSLQRDFSASRLANTSGRGDSSFKSRKKTMQDLKRLTSGPGPHRNGGLQVDHVIDC